MPEPRFLARLLIPGGVVLAGLAAYANSFSGTFVLDDLPHLVDNPGIRRLWPIPGAGETVEGAWRPLTMWSFAVNYALGGLEPAGFHSVNLLIHLLAAVTLFVLVRDTLRLPSVLAAGNRDPELAAGAVALLWVLHPLQTESVTYLVQRGEALAGLCHLLVLWCSLKSWEHRESWRWPVAGWVACAAGMAAKESMVVTPLAAVLFDRALHFPSFAAAWRQRARWWAALALTWLLLARFTPSAATYTPGGVEMREIYMYALTQPGVVVHYLRLALWPRGLTLEEAWPLVGSPGEAIPALVVLSGIATVVIVACRRHPALIAVAAWTALVLAPTSSVIPLRDPAVEHRMYLPLAGVILLAVLAAGLGIRRCGDWLGWDRRRQRLASTGCVTAAAVLLGLGTVQRNATYHSQLAMYADVVAKRPGSLRGRQNLAVALIDAERLEEARDQLQILVELKPDYAEGHYNLGYVLGRLGRFKEAEAEYRTALRFKPDYVPAQVNLRLLEGR